MKARTRDLVAAAGFASAVFAAGAVGSRVGPSPDRPATSRWYRRLDTPSFQPPAKVFAPVWTALYATIAASGWRVWKHPPGSRRRRALALWAAQMAANAGWSPIFFGARAPRAALADLTAQLGLTGAYVATSAPLDPLAAALMGPYLAWTTFAGVLNEEVVRRN